MDVAWRQHLGSWWRKEGEEEGERSGSLWESLLPLSGSSHTSDGPGRDTFHGSPLFSCKSLDFRVPRDWLIGRTTLAFFHESNSSTTLEAPWAHVHETESTFATSGRDGEWGEKDTKGKGGKWREKTRRVSKLGKKVEEIVRSLVSHLCTQKWKNEIVFDSPVPRQSLSPRSLQYQPWYEVNHSTLQGTKYALYTRTHSRTHTNWHIQIDRIRPTAMI